MNKLLILFILVYVPFSVFASGCPLKVPNVIFCADKGKFGAICGWTREADKKARLSKLEWDKMRIGWFCTNAAGLGEMEKFIAMACAQNKNCIDQTRQFIDGIKEESR